MFRFLAEAAASSYFSPAQFWTIVGVALTAFGLMGAWITRLRNAAKSKKAESLELYIHFVDDLQVELKRLHDLLNEERRESARLGEEKDLKIERLEARIVELQTKIREFQQKVQELEDRPPNGR